jgi:hypothetical protein
MVTGMPLATDSPPDTGGSAGEEPWDDHPAVMNTSCVGEPHSDSAVPTPAVRDINVGIRTDSFRFSSETSASLGVRVVSQADFVGGAT